jgi:hypothetical protein
MRFVYEFQDCPMQMTSPNAVFSASPTEDTV